MNFHQVDRLADHFVLPGLASVLAQGCTNTAETLAYIAVADERKLYLPAAYPSMYQYCLGELHMSGDAAAKRIHVARAARKFPVIFDAVAEGRLHLSGAVLLAPHLAPENAAELMAAATHKSKAEIETLLAERFPKPDVPALVMAISPTDTAGHNGQDPVCENGEQHAPGHVDPASSRPRVTPLAPERFAVQFSMGQEAHDELRYLQALLGHAASGDVGEVYRDAVKTQIEKLEKRIFAATSRPRPGRGSAHAHHVPAAVKREVWVRDGGQCTFVSDRGHRCEARTRLEFDHVDTVARGGQSTVHGVRMLCRGHNQHAAECTFGKGFMREKREEARHQRQEARTRRAAAAETVRAPETAAADGAPQQTRAIAPADAAPPQTLAIAPADAAPPRPRANGETMSAAALEVVPWLRAIGFSADEARRAAARAAEALPHASLEERVRYALKTLAPGCARRSPYAASSPG